MKFHEEHYYDPIGISETIRVHGVLECSRDELAQLEASGRAGCDLIFDPRVPEGEPATGEAPGRDVHIGVAVLKIRRFFRDGLGAAEEEEVGKALFELYDAGAGALRGRQGER